MENRIITPITTSIGVVRIVWTNLGSVSKVLQILLPRDVRETDVPLCSILSGSARRLHDNIEHIGLKIQDFLNGGAIVFSPGDIDMAMVGCSPFQQQVFIQTCKIPRGMVMSYSRLSETIGVPKGARSVGSALAMNPFPLIIPCHRVIRKSGYLGGFGGGLHLKRLLLEKEGIAFDLEGRVLKSCFLI
jgi:methylated-DNA-[protein]-cysteine S-methyltransferase